MLLDNHDGTKSRKVKTLNVKADYSAFPPKNKKVQRHYESLLRRPRLVLNAIYIYQQECRPGGQLISY